MYVGALGVPRTIQPSCSGSHPAPGAPGGTFARRSGNSNPPTVLRSQNETVAPVTLGCTTAFGSSGMKDPFHTNLASPAGGTFTTYLARVASWAGPARVQSSA